MTDKMPFVSVIIPTYNRLDSLRRTLTSLEQQDYPHECFEVVVVDDGSTPPPTLPQTLGGITIVFLRQQHQGGTAAKNAGAKAGRGEWLIFLDDDITVAPSYVRVMVQALSFQNGSIVTGKLLYVSPAHTSSWPEAAATHGAQLEQVQFTACLGGFFGIARDAFTLLGGLQDPTPGYWPNWEDVDFFYRAHLNGIRFYRMPGVIGLHWDYASADLAASCSRQECAGRSAYHLIRRHPEIASYIPMIEDKLPISVGTDSPSMIVNKLFHVVTGTRPVFWVLRALAGLASPGVRIRSMTGLLPRWLKSAYFYRGLRAERRQAGRGDV